MQACLDEPPRRTAFSIGHRGAGLVLPEHTLEAYEAGYRMGAGTLECDVTFTKDLELVCRHAQNDLATTTDILLTPLASTCIEPFTPARLDANGAVRRPARAECRTSELTLAEFKTLRGKIDAFDPAAQTVEEFVAPRRAPRPDLGDGLERGTLLTHAESIALFKRLGVRMTPELKEASVELPWSGLTREQLAQRLIDEYRAAGVPPSDVFPQSFDRRDVEYWIEHEPEYGEQAVLLDDAVFRGAPRARRLRALQGGRHQHLGAAAVRAARSRCRGANRAVARRTRRACGGPRHHHVDARALGQPRRAEQRLLLPHDRRGRHARRRRHARSSTCSLATSACAASSPTGRRPSASTRAAPVLP